MVPATPESEEAWTLHPRQEAETPLLAVVKTLVKRRQSVSIALVRGAAGGERIGIALSALDRIFRRPFGARTECKVAARRGEIAIGLFERGPRLLLLGRQLQSGMQRSDTRIKKGRTIFRSELLTPPEIRAGGRLLCIGGRCRDEHERGRAGCHDLLHGSLPAEELELPH